MLVKGMNEIAVINKINKKASELTVDDVEIFCQEAGITIERVCKKLNILMDGGKEIRDPYGNYKWSEPDNNVQYKAAMACVALLDLIKKKDVIVGGVIEHRLSDDERAFREKIAEKIIRGRELRRIEVGETVDI